MSTKKSTEPSLTEIAKRILVHLQRFENDPKINKRRWYDKKARKWVVTTDDSQGTRDYFMVNAYRGGARVRVSYINYQGASTLTREDALTYLAWLDAGNVGRHWNALKAAEIK